MTKRTEETMFVRCDMCGCEGEEFVGCMENYCTLRVQSFLKGLKGPQPASDFTVDLCWECSKDLQGELWETDTKPFMPIGTPED